MTSDEQNALRALLREEVNAAVYASEQRIGERFGRLDGHMSRLETAQRNLETEVAQVRVDLTQTISLLDDATKVINELQANQRAVELKVEQNLLGLRRDMQRLTDTVHSFAHHFIDVNRATNDRISVHEKTPIEETHPYPHSAA